MTGRILLQGGAHLMVGTALLTVVQGGAPSFTPLTLGAFLTFVAYTVAYALLDLVPLHLEFRRHAHTITITEAVLIASAFHMSPLAAVGAAVLGELLACLKNRLPVLQVSFNVAQTFGAASVALTVFTAIGPTEATSVQAWAAVFAAAASFALVSMVSVVAVLTVVEGTPFRRIISVASFSTGLTALASAALGLALLTLAEGAPAAPLLLAPVVALVLLESKRVTDAAAERLRFKRLYDASSRTARLSRVDEAVTVLANEARDLLTGAQAICCAQADGGRWSAVVVDDRGARPLHPEAVDALVSLSGSHTVELSHGEIPEPLRNVFKRNGDVIIAPAEPTSAGQVVLAVANPHGSEKRESHLVEVLSAFAGTAALAIGNARLYAEVEAALRHQVDLNRQKADFVAAVSHELRTPLAAMIGSVQTIRRLGDRLPEADARQLFEAALDQGSRLRRLIEDLLLVAATEHQTATYVPKSVNVDSLFRKLEQQFSAARGSNRLTVSTGTGAGELFTDEEKLHRVLTNLIENAMKYAPEGPIEVLAHQAYGSTSFTVSDHGPGIPVEQRGRVFERFVQLDQSSTRREGGTGLGLYLCANIAEQLGGTLTVGDRDHGAPGAVFHLTLPGHAPVPAAPTEVSDSDLCSGRTT